MKTIWPNAEFISVQGTVTISARLDWVWPEAFCDELLPFAAASLEAH